MNGKIPLSVLIENAKAELTQAFNQTLENSRLPAFLMEGIVLDLLAEVRKQKAIELISDTNRMYNNNSEKERNKDGLR